MGLARNLVAPDRRDDLVAFPENQAAQDVPDLAVCSGRGDETGSAPLDESPKPVLAKHRISVRRLLVFGVLPALAILFGGAAGYFQWTIYTARVEHVAEIDAVAAARDSTTALLSYQPDTAATVLTAAEGRLTGTFKESYSQLIRDIVIPGSQQRRVAVKASVPNAAAISATATRVTVLVCVNQTTTIGTDMATDSTSSVRVTMDKSGDRWLISAFDPI
jgi:Mce-associated membrane protein